MQYNFFVGIWESISFTTFLWVNDGSRWNDYVVYGCVCAFNLRGTR